MALLLDNDVVHKLAQMDLLVDSKDLLESEFGSLAILQTLKYKLCPTPPNKRVKAEEKYGTKVVFQIESFIQSIEEIDIEIKHETLKEAHSLNPIELNIGEMQLLQSLLDSGDDLMFTGDKRFLRALSNQECIQKVLPKINGCFICFEQVITLLINKLGFDLIKQKFLQAVENNIPIDKTLKICMEGAENSKEKQVLSNLAVYISDLRRETKELLKNLKIAQTTPELIS